MSKYTGSTCICCGERFADGDDIVVCPDCGTPYHRKCYLEKGSCINTILHDKNVGWLPDAPEEQPIPTVSASSVKRCIRCGAENPPEERYCEQCGTPLINMEAPRPFNETKKPEQNTASQAAKQIGGLEVQPVMLNQDSDIDGVTLGDLARYVGSNPIGFLPSFIKFAKTGRKLSMNLFAFLFTPVYFMYRKMTVWGIVFGAMMALLGVPSMIELLSSGDMGYKIDFGINVKSQDFIAVSQALMLITMGVKVVAGFFANYIYYKQARKDIMRIHDADEGKSADDVNKEIILAGGTSWGHVLLGYLIYTIVSFGAVVIIGKLV